MWIIVLPHTVIIALSKKCIELEYHLKQNTRKKMFWCGIRDTEIRDLFNLILQNTLQDFAGLGCSRFCKHVIGVAKEVAN